jgi:hypothetical protein
VITPGWSATLPNRVTSELPEMREPQTGSGFSPCNVPAFIAWELTNTFNGCPEWIGVVGGHTRVAILMPRCDLKTEP